MSNAGTYCVWYVPCQAGLAAGQPDPGLAGTVPQRVLSQLAAPAVWPVPALAALSWPLPGERQAITYGQQ